VVEVVRSGVEMLVKDLVGEFKEEEEAVNGELKGEEATYEGEVVWRIVCNAERWDGLKCARLVLGGGELRLSCI